MSGSGEPTGPRIRICGFSGHRAPQAAFSHAWRALRHRNFRLFFGGQTISLIGTWMTRIATAWLVYRLTKSALLLGTVSFAGQIPTFLFAPFAGVWVDRLNRRQVLVWTQTLPWSSRSRWPHSRSPATSPSPGFSALSVMQGIINAFDMPGRQSFMVQMVDDRADLGNAIAINSSMVNVARLIGPSLAGMLIAATNEGWCFLIDGISYIAVIASLLMMRLHVRQSGVRPPRCSRVAGGLELCLGFPAHPHHSAALCRGQPDGHAIRGAHAHLCGPGAAWRPAYAGIPDGRHGRGRAASRRSRWPRAKACAA